MSFAIRPLRTDEAELYREVRLEALRMHPDGFSASFEQEAAQPPGFFVDRLTGSVVFGGFPAPDLPGPDILGPDLLGIAGFTVQAGAKSKHKGALWGMYVRPSARRSGLSRLLVEAVLDHARQLVELVQLSVVADNLNARRLYASLGFEPYGFEPRALKLEERYLDFVLMAKRLI